MTEFELQAQPGPPDYGVAQSENASFPWDSGVSPDVVSERQHPLWQRAVKRTADFLIALIIAPVALVIIGVIATLIVIVDRQKPFFADRRVGRAGRQFGCFKLRTMREDEAALVAYLTENEDESLRWLESRKVGCDPRVTRFGAWLRHSSLDELPQLLNVLLGHMSLIGPRPLSEREFRARPEPSQRLLEQVRPGITGLWQVTGRSGLSNERRIELDDEYSREWSLRGDFLIVLKTPVAVIARTGAR